MSLLFKNKDYNYQLLEDKKYCIALDLSTVSTGIALVDLQTENIIEVWAICIPHSEDSLYLQARAIKQQIRDWELDYRLDNQNCIFAKEKQPIQYGMKTTINTLVSIAKLHGMIEEYFYDNDIPVLDIAVPTIRKIVVKNYKASKEEVFDALQKKYQNRFGDKGGHDMADAVAVALASVEALRQEYEEQIKELKREKKKYKSSKKLEEIEEQIKVLKRKMSIEKN